MLLLGSAVVDLVDDVVNLSGSTWEDMCAGMGQMDVEVLAAFMAASADCMAKWARINGVTWNQVRLIDRPARPSQNGQPKTGGGG